MERSWMRALSQKKPRSASFTVYLDLSATCPLGRVAPAQCKCYFELDFRKMTVAEVKRQFGNFVSAPGTHTCASCTEDFEFSRCKQGCGAGGFRSALNYNGPA